MPGAAVKPASVAGRCERKVNKSITAIRLSHDVPVVFKATGKGWQTRMDAVLKQVAVEGKI